MSNTNYPGAVDTITNPATTDTLATVPHHLQHGVVNDAVTAIETKLGFGSSLQTPVQGGFLVSNTNGNSQWQVAPTSPQFTTSINDPNGKVWIGQTPAGASAVNYLNISNSATTVAPALSALGTDSNISLNLVPKGSGTVQDNGTPLIDFRSSFGNYVKSGGVWTIGSGLQGNATAAVLFIAGVEYTVAATSGHTFAVSSDTYVDYTVGSGITYTAVANNAASPALAANSIRLAIIITSGAAITSINQGSTAAVAPVISSNTIAVSDSLGNLIYPNDPSNRTLGYRQILNGVSTSSATFVQITGLSVPVQVPTGRRVKIIFRTRGAGNTTVDIYTGVSIWDGTVGSGTQLAEAYANVAAAAGFVPLPCEAYQTPSVISKTYNVGFLAQANTSNVGATAVGPTFVAVELA